MSANDRRISPVPLPPDSQIARVYAAMDYADAYAVELPSGASTDPERLARFIFEAPSPLGHFLLRVRDFLVGSFGLKTATDKRLKSEDGVSRIAFFRIYSRSLSEIVLGEDDKHLDFRVSVLCSEAPSGRGGRCLTLSTVVCCHNRWGRLYFFVIAPFHRRLVQSSLRRAARIGWPSAQER